MNTLLREKQLKYIDIEEMRVVTNDRHVAEQIKRDKVESVVTNGSKVGEFGKVGREQNVKNVVMNGVKKWRSWRIWKIAKVMRRCGARVRRDFASQS